MLVFAGCSTAQHGSRALDWTEGTSGVTNQNQTVQVPEEPRIAAPPAAPELPVAHTNAAPQDAWVSLDRWCREHRIGTVRATSLAPLPTFALTTSYGVLVLQVKSRIAKWNGLELHLGFEPQLVGELPFVHSLDLQKNIEPLLQPLVLPEPDHRTIVIDPGHGGALPGAASVLNNGFEKEFTLDWAMRLAPLLARGGWRVFLTRTNDTDIALSNRVAFAEEHKADLFISLHFNSAAPNQEQAGLETFCLTPTGMSSTLTREFADDVSRVFPNNAFDRENLGYAVRLHRALLAVCGRDRGVRRARFLGVLRGQQRPAILIEGGYLSNPQEARRIADPAFRQRLAEALADALARPPAVPATNSPSVQPAPAESSGQSNAPVSREPSFKAVSGKP
jgi:N-acetylmuramoyl-L-alanine amidase